jgi:hypothetical protein
MRIENQVRRILFLDFDGVLNSSQFNKAMIMWGHRTRGGRIKEFCEIAASNLNQILTDVPDVQIVVSSSWRIGETLEGLRNILEMQAMVPRERVIGMTPSHYLGEVNAAQGGTDRGLEIQQWLNDHPYDGETRFVILDDNSDMAHLMDNLVQTDWDHGLQLSHAKECIKKFAPTSECDDCGNVLTWASGGLCDPCLKGKVRTELAREAADKLK